MDGAVTAFVTAIVTFIATAFLIAILSSEARKSDLKAGVTIIGDKAYRLVPLEVR